MEIEEKKKNPVMLPWAKGKGGDGKVDGKAMGKGNTSTKAKGVKGKK